MKMTTRERKKSRLGESQTIEQQLRQGTGIWGVLNGVCRGNKDNCCDGNMRRFLRQHRLLGDNLIMLKYQMVYQAKNCGGFD